MSRSGKTDRCSQTYTPPYPHKTPPFGPGDRQSPGGGIYKLRTSVTTHQSLCGDIRVCMAYYQNPAPPVPQPQPVYWQPQPHPLQQLQQPQQQLLPIQYQYQAVQQYQPIYQPPQYQQLAAQPAPVPQNYSPPALPETAPPVQQVLPPPPPEAQPPLPDAAPAGPSMAGATVQGEANAAVPAVPTINITLTTSSRGRLCPSCCALPASTSRSPPARSCHLPPKNTARPRPWPRR